MTSLKIEYESSDGATVSARWGQHVSGIQFDEIVALAEKIIGHDAH
jgi:hypothetical protein